MIFTTLRANHMLDTAMDGVSVLLEHESNALSNLWSGLRMRFSVAKKARNVGELLRHQIDLLPDTHARLKRDHSVRSALIRGFGRDLRSSLTRRRGT